MRTRRPGKHRGDDVVASIPGGRDPEHTDAAADVRPHAEDLRRIGDLGLAAGEELL